MWGFCGCCNHRRTEPIRDDREWVSVRKPCKRKCDDDCGCHQDRDCNDYVSPSSFCERQLRAAEDSCVANPFSNFSRCRR